MGSRVRLSLPGYPDSNKQKFFPRGYGLVGRHGPTSGVIREEGR